MTVSLNYYWRLIMTGVFFAIFGIGSVFLSTVIFPLVRFIPGKRSCMRMRWIIHKIFIVFLWLMQKTGVMRLTVSGREKLRDCHDMLVLANHPTSLDAVVLISLIPIASCVVKAALWENPFMSGTLRAASYIKNSKPEILIVDCVADLATGKPLLIFPEGTRSEPGQPLRFLRGSAYIALKSGKPILPVLIFCDPPTLTKNDKWYDIPKHIFHMRVVVQEPIMTTRWIAADDVSPIAVRTLTYALQDYFTKELETHGIAKT